MEFESSSLFREVSAILNSGDKPVHYNYEADIHVGGQTFRAVKVTSIDFQDDYENNVAETVIVTCQLLGGTYAKRIYRNQSNMDITLYRRPIGEVSDLVDDTQPPQAERYTAILIDKGNPLMEGNTGGILDEETLNLSNIFEISFQLINKTLEQLRMITVGGIYRFATVQEVIRDTLTRESQRVTVEGVRMPQGVDMVEADNQATRDHLIIPQGTRLVDLPRVVHHKCGGVYNAGLGYYLQGDWWYVYPCYDVTRFETCEHTLTVINVPPNKLPSVERTYRQNGRNTVVLATSEVRYRNDTDSRQLNQGNGVRFADANKFMDGFADTKANKSVLSRGANASEFISTPRPNGFNQVQLSKNQITANPFVEYSELARNQGSFLGFVWENSNPSLIYPGMMAKFLWLQEEEIQEVYGVVLKVHTYSSLKGQGMTAARYQCNSSVTIFIQPDLPSS